VKDKTEGNSIDVLVGHKMQQFVTELTFSMQHQQCKVERDSQAELNMCHKVYRYGDIKL
jgi:hypothetical protein